MADAPIILTIPEGLDRMDIPESAIIALKAAKPFLEFARKAMLHRVEYIDGEIRLLEELRQYLSGIPDDAGPEIPGSASLWDAVRESLAQGPATTETLFDRLVADQTFKKAFDIPLAEHGFLLQVMVLQWTARGRLKKGPDGVLSVVPEREFPTLRPGKPVRSITEAVSVILAEGPRAFPDLLETIPAVYGKAVKKETLQQLLSRGKTAGFFGKEGSSWALAKTESPA